ncbi:hypothetical protein ABT373_26355 [Streptomyces sp. NPDC000070]|uniref:hypothetical protein n=1 Tax=Streptomyces sp. NPDC000070 TaxID=3154240 RepID=UPI003319A1C4
MRKAYEQGLLTEADIDTAVRRLLKNSGDLLPLTPGTTAPPPPLEGRYERFGAEHVQFAEGVDRIRLKTSPGSRAVPGQG